MSTKINNDYFLFTKDGNIKIQVREKEIIHE